MKIFIIPFAILLLFLASCEKITDLELKGSQSYGNFFKNEQNIVTASNALYLSMNEEEFFGRGFFWYINASDDMVTGRIKAYADNIKNFILTGNEEQVKNMYDFSYQTIQKANNIILNVPQIAIDEKLKNRIIGEAYFIRGFCYFWLAHTHGDNVTNGGVPIITEKNMNDIGGSYTRPKSVIENYAQIVEDLKKAAELLPLFTTYASKDLGRAHKDAAFAYIAKTYLYWAEYDNTKYAEAVKYVDMVTNSGSGRGLVNTGNPAKDYRELHSHKENWGKEYIWSVVSGVKGGSKLPGVMLENKGWGKYNGWGYYMPTNELYEEYEENDVRRSVTILKFGDNFKYFGEDRKYYSENSPSGFQFNKYMYEYELANAIGTTVNSNGDDPTTAYNVPLMRYAELLLIKAEALIMQGLNGDEPLNKVRERAGLKPVSGATMKDLKHERRCELAGEFSNRHFDLVRWGDAKATYAKPLHGRVHTVKTNPNSPYEIKEIWASRNFNPIKNHVWPLPNIALTSKIKQNKGW